MFGNGSVNAGMAALNAMPVRLSGGAGLAACACSSGVGLAGSTMRTRGSTSSGVRM